MKNSVNSQPAGEGNEAEKTDQPGNSKPGYHSDDRFGFCPQKELNLPADYDEVVARFKRLQAGRAMESLN